MYYPEFLTETNLYTNGGEFALASTRENYIGYYWKTFDGLYFTNKNPQQIPYQPLISFTEIRTQDNVDSFINEFPNYPKNNLNQKISENPISYNPQPIQNDYENGFFSRYFSKPINSNTYKEISSQTYSLIIGQSSEINYALNETIQVRWILKGSSKDEVFKQNKIIVEYTELNSNFKYLGQFLRFNYSKFYQA